MQKPTFTKPVVQETEDNQVTILSKAGMLSLTIISVVFFVIMSMKVPGFFGFVKISGDVIANYKIAFIVLTLVLWIGFNAKKQPTRTKPSVRYTEKT
jgi:hypothetical protein